MKITETIERECCQRQDLKPYHGKTLPGYIVHGGSSNSVKFCIHCGQIWVTSRQMDAAGGKEDVLIRLGEE